MTTAQPNPAATPATPQKRRALRAEHRTLRVRRVPARYGWHWLIEGFALWLRAPVFLTFLTLGFLLTTLVPCVIPFIFPASADNAWLDNVTSNIGILISLILYPGMFLSLVNGCRAIDRKRRLSPGLLFSGFRRRPLELMLAGLCNLVAWNIILLLSYPIDDGILWRLFSQATMDPLNLNMIQVKVAFVVFGSMLLLWGMACLYTPQLIGWWRLSVTQAFITSFRGCLRNWLPLLVYSLCYGIFIVSLAPLVINFIAVTTEGLGILACFAYLLIILPVVFASFYVAARDIYGFPRRRKHRPHARQTPRTMENTEKTAATMNPSE